MKANGYVLHETENRVVIATGFSEPSENEKTGPMIQIWILVKDLKPTEALKAGMNSLVCGGCLLQGDQTGKERTCYVNLGQGPRAVWQAYKNGSYPALPSVDVFRGRRVRFGAYGDPVFIPFPLVQAIAAVAEKWTGYTHQWRNPIYSAYKQFVMASTENLTGTTEAHNAGWRTFRVAPEGSMTTGKNEIVCVNTTRGIQCFDCGLCNGTTSGAKSIVIEAHGSGKGNLA